MFEEDMNYDDCPFCGGIWDLDADECLMCGADTSDMQKLVERVERGEVELEDIFECCRGE